ncbi:MAG: DUF975 family protein [Christensenella sp.]|uniref:DUF975 family protein n=1 Tax=Christensenella sp. TaxID=1935934 RepID=UPI002B21A972|nr:DUF975 family protein [Christensenella sp.]MEA5004372.1 DUF975 family protein [Christensenella sp.]
MKKRRKIKRISQVNVSGQYWKSVAVMIIVSVIPFFMMWTGSLITLASLYQTVFVFDLSLLRTVSATISSVALGVILALMQPILAVGNAGVFIDVYKNKGTSIAKAFGGFANFGNALGGMLWMILWIFLWSILLIVPGVVKSYSYFMTPYILADCPHVYGPDAVEISKRMMRGYKAKLFVAQLSFLGWLILCIMTLGTLWIFYVGPYYNTVMAGYYQEIKLAAIKSGAVTQEEFNGAELRPTEV